MFFEINGTWYVRGIVSFTVFTDVSKYREWIMRYTGMQKSSKSARTIFKMVLETIKNQTKKNPREYRNE